MPSLTDTAMLTNGSLKVIVLYAHAPPYVAGGSLITKQLRRRCPASLNKLNNVPASAFSIGEAVAHAELGIRGRILGVPACETGPPPPARPRSV
jgi:hypothetical protein